LIVPAIRPVNVFDGEVPRDPQDGKSIATHAQATAATPRRPENLRVLTLSLPERTADRTA
jgi:hypothetical protein